MTATPVTNSVAECFSMLRIFAPKVLEQRGVRNVQHFMDQYCQLETKTAVSPTGKIVHGKALVGFININDLSQMWRDAMITRTARSEGMVLPAPIEKIVEIPQTEEIKSFIQSQRERTGSHRFAGLR